MNVREVLHQVSIDSDCAVLIPTTADLVRQQSFIDGRTNFSTGPPRQIRLSDFVAAESAPAPPASYIFHMAFGGSTLLSRLLDNPGEALVLREPNCLAQLANEKASGRYNGEKAAEFGEILASVRNHLGRPWADAEQVVVKPSNWANNLLPDLMGGDLRPAILFLVSSREAFVRSVIRGGDERIAFAARAAAHLSEGDGAKWVASALASTDSAPDQLVRLACVLHAIQIESFRSNGARVGLGQANWLSRDELFADPFQSARRAANALGLKLPDSAIKENIAAWATKDAKDPRRPFIRSEQDKRESALAVEHAAVIDSALAWAERYLGPDLSAAPA